MKKLLNNLYISKKIKYNNDEYLIVSFDEKTVSFVSENHFEEYMLSGVNFKQSKYITIDLLDDTDGSIIEENVVVDKIFGYKVGNIGVPIECVDLLS